LTGNFCDKTDQLRSGSTAWGSTNFQSVIDEVVRIRISRPEVPIEDYPETLLVVSDMQMNSTGNRTNYETAMDKLANVGLPHIDIIWWNVNGSYGNDVPNKMDDAGVTMISGFDGAIVSNILGTDDVVDEATGQKRKANPEEVMLNALNQEILNMVTT
jgi:hypothetical protein